MSRFPTLRIEIPVLHRESRMRYLWALALCVLAALVTAPLHDHLDLADNVMPFLLTVFIIAVKLGRGPAVFSSLVCVVMFDWIFVLPHPSFILADPQHLITLTVMLTVSLVTSHLAAQLAERTEAAQAHERETQTLYEVARDLGAALREDQVADILRRFLEPLGVEVIILIDAGIADEERIVTYGKPFPDADEFEQALTAYRNNTVVAADGKLFLPFSGATRTRGVLAVMYAKPLRRQMLEAMASLAGINVERLHYAEVAQRNELDAQAEKLRSSILASISHDLRTPLTSLVGMADALADKQVSMPEELRRHARVIRDQALAMHRMVTNLLDMARLQSGRTMLNKEWQPFEDVVGSGARLLEDILSGHPLEIELPDDLPLVCFDAVLMERVICNLLENAAKYSTPGTVIRVCGRISGQSLVFDVCNAGAGFPPDRLEQVFEMFTRGSTETAIPGTGIGLALCRAIISAHGGTIRAENRSGEACVRISLPLGNPPEMEDETQ